MSEEKPKTEEVPPVPVKVQQVLPSVFQRFDGGELPGFLKAWSNDGPKKVDLKEIVEESELSIDQIKSEWKCKIIKTVERSISMKKKLMILIKRIPSNLKNFLCKLNGTTRKRLRFEKIHICYEKI